MIELDAAKNPESSRCNSPRVCDAGERRGPTTLLLTHVWGGSGMDAYSHNGWAHAAYVSHANRVSAHMYG